MEIFVKPGADGALEQQAVMLKPPAVEENVIIEPRDLPGRRSLRLSVSVGDDGITDVTATSSEEFDGTPPGQGSLHMQIDRDRGMIASQPDGGASKGEARSVFSTAWENDELHQTLLELKGSLSSSASSGAADAAPTSRGPAAQETQETQQKQAAASSSSLPGLGSLDAVFTEAQAALKTSAEALKSAMLPGATPPAEPSPSSAPAAASSQQGANDAPTTPASNLGVPAPPDFEVIGRVGGVDSQDDDGPDVASSNEEDEEVDLDDEVIELNRMPADVIMESRWVTASE